MSGCGRCGAALLPRAMACVACGTAVGVAPMAIQDSVITGTVHTGNVVHHHQHVTQVQQSRCGSCGSVNPPGLRTCAVPTCGGSACENCGTYKGEQVSLCATHHIHCSCGLTYRHQGEDLIQCQEETCAKTICNRCRKPTMRNLGLTDAGYMCTEHNRQITMLNIGLGVGIGLMFLLFLMIAAI